MLKKSESKNHIGSRLMSTVKASAGRAAYDIDIVYDCQNQLIKKLKKIAKTRRVVIISNPTVWKLYGKDLQKALEPSFDILLVKVGDGEKYKSLSVASKIYTKLIDGKVMRNDLIIALGGGVIGDLAGFVASTYLRGINFIQIPTTLVAQVDSSIGGKVAVNHPKGKNMIGAFYQPKYVFADLNTLNTLPDREFSAGLAEVVKTALISSADFYKFLDKNLEKILVKDSTSLAEAVRLSAEFKSKIVKIDERDLGLRAILNFGHTMGHALEVLKSYGTLLHGEGVGIGMVYAAIISRELGYLKQKQVEGIFKMISRCGLPVKLPPNIKFAQVMEQFDRDKKKVSGSVTFITLKKIGEPVIEEVDRSILESAFKIHKNI